MKIESFDRTKYTFMAVIFFIFRKPVKGMPDIPYTLTEIAAKENRKQQGSYDFEYKKNDTAIRNESLGFEKLKKMIQWQFKGRYFGGYIIHTKSSLVIAKFGKHGYFKEVHKPIFVTNIITINKQQFTEVLVKEIEPIDIINELADTNTALQKYENKMRKLNS